MPKSSNPAEVKVTRSKFDFSSFGTAAKDMLRSAINGEFGDSLKTLGNYWSGHFDTPEDQLFRLVWSAAIPAFTRILKNKFGERFESVYGKSQDELFLGKELATELYEVEFSADANFLSEPHRHPQTEALKAFFKSWLVNTLQISAEQAAVSAAAFPRLFLHEMVKVDPALYGNLLDYFKRPAYKALKKEALIEAYHAHIMAEYDRPAFSDLRVSLDDLYVEPNFLYYKPKKNQNEAALRKDDFVAPTIDIPLHDFIIHWLNGKSALKIPKENAPLLLLLGQPGQGKSSFVYRTVYQLLSGEQTKPERVFMLRLRDLGAAEESALINTPLEVLLAKINRFGFEEYPIKIADLHHGLLILDGLDELYMNRSMSLDDIQNFLRNLSKEIQVQAEKFNQPIRFKCILTSRHNYVKIHDFKASGGLLVLSLAEMNLVQQKEWLNRYEAHCPRHLDASKTQETVSYLQGLRKKMEELAEHESENTETKNLRELLNQPILLQLIVESRANLHEHSSRVAVYDSIFNAVIERKYADGQKIPGLEKIETTDYRRFLQLLALQMYHSKHLYIRRADFEREPLQSFVKGLCDKSGNTQLDARNLAKDLLVGFYFRSVRKEDDQDEQDRAENYAFEFMHNSLFEYLVAEHIWAYFKYELTDKNNRTGQFVIPFEKAFEDLFKLFSPRLLSAEVVRNIRALIELEPDAATELLPLFERLRQDIFPRMLSHDCLLEYRFDQNNAERSPLDLSLAVFYGMITVMGPLAIRFVPYPDVNVKDSDYVNKREQNLAAANFVPSIHLKRFTDFLQLLGRANAPIHFTLHSQFLFGANLSGANLNKTELRGADLRGAVLYGTDLNSSDLSGVDLKGNYLGGAFLSGVDLSMADLRWVFLRRAFLRNSNLSDADLSEADLSEVDLSEADLSESNLCKANFSRVDLSFTDLCGADLSEANIAEAILVGTKFCKANLSFANLRGTDFSGADLRWAEKLELTRYLNEALNLDQADFTDTIYEGKIHKRPDGSFEIEGYTSQE